MTSSLRARIAVSLLLVWLTVVTIVAWVAEPTLEDRARDVLRNQLMTAIAALEGAINEPLPETELFRESAQNGVLFTLFDEQGQSITGSHTDRLEADLITHLQATQPTTDHETRWFIEIEGRLALVQPIDRQRTLVVSKNIPSLSTASSALRKILVIGSLVFFILFVVLSEYFTRTIAMPVRQMKAVASAIRMGDLSDRIRSRREDELGALASSIDQMADQLVDRFEALRREEARLRTMLESMVEGVLVTDPSGRIVLTNKALVRMTRGEVLGRTAIEAIRSAELHEAVARANSGEASEVQFEIHIQAQRRTIAAQVSPLPKHAGVVAVLHDISAIKRIDAVRRDFVANASHELRTPLTAIRGFAETLLDGALDQPTMARRFVGNIEDNAVRLSRLVNDLLALSKAEAPDAGFELTRVNIVEVAQGVVRSLEVKAHEKAQTLELQIQQPISEALADARALDQILINLIDNAIKYTPENGHINVKIRQAENRLCIDVNDSGPGIPKKHLNRVFERFYRVDRGRAREQGGTGLGLSIVRHLVEQLRGKIEVESEVGVGSTFRLKLRIARQSGEVEAQGTST